MAGYRFCRTDDVPLLVEAYNACCGIHLPGDPPFGVDEFRSAVRDLNLWPSSCMVAMEGGEPIGVLLAAKRDHATLVHRIGIRPGRQRRGHGRHLLGSLGNKLAILGPPRIEAEVPEDRPDLIALFASCGYTPGAAFADLVLDPLPPCPSGATDAGLPVTFDELQAAGLLTGAAGRSWRRSPETLENRKGRLTGLALASPERIEAWLLHGAGACDGSREILAMGCAGSGQSRALLGMLVQRFAGREATHVVLPGISPEEMDFGRLESWGFRVTRRYRHHVAAAGQGWA